jgi:hypothetical protein
MVEFVIESSRMRIDEISIIASWVGAADSRTPTDFELDAAELTPARAAFLLGWLTRESDPEQVGSDRAYAVAQFMLEARLSLSVTMAALTMVMNYDASRAYK